MRFKIKNRTARRSPRQNRRERSALSTAGLWLMIGMLIGIITATASYLLITGKWSIMPSAYIVESKAEEEVLNPENLNNITKANKTENPEQTNHVQRFEFYQLLPGMEVPIPDPAPTKAPAASHTLAGSAVEPSSLPTSDPNPTFESPEIIQKPLTPKVSKPDTQAISKSSKVAIKKPLHKPVPKVSKPDTQKKLAAAQYLIQAGAFREQQKAENLKSRLGAKGFTTRIQKIDAEDGIWFRVILGPFPTESIALNQKILLTKHKIQGILLLQRR